MAGTPKAAWPSLRNEDWPLLRNEDWPLLRNEGWPLLRNEGWPSLRNEGWPSLRNETWPAACPDAPGTPQLHRPQISRSRDAPRSRLAMR
ncbi:MAG: hypothetical protein JO345_20850 [Streptosporangiaceae bacterium]|nr:hypothetical protein [Streptosporangiaceae bacterium]